MNLYLAGTAILFLPGMCYAEDMGQPKSPEHRAKIAAALRGKKKSESHVKAMSDCRIGRKQNPEQVAAMKAGIEAAKLLDPKLMVRGRSQPGRKNPRWIKDREHAAKLKRRAATCADVRRGLWISDDAPKFFATYDYWPSELCAHLESLFEPGMSWENYGRNGWTIDHVKPVHEFSLGVRIRVINALPNLRPLWAGDNWRRNKVAV